MPSGPGFIIEALAVPWCVNILMFVGFLLTGFLVQHDGHKSFVG